MKRDFSIASNIIGFIVLFSLLFNGGIGAPIYNWSATICGLSFMLAGTSYLLSRKSLPAFIFAVIAAITYIPIIHLRFTWESGPDWAAFGLDIPFMGLALLLVYLFKPNKSLKNGTPESGAP